MLVLALLLALLLKLLLKLVLKLELLPKLHLCKRGWWDSDVHIPRYVPSEVYREGQTVRDESHIEKECSFFGFDKHVHTATWQTRRCMQTR